MTRTISFPDNKILYLTDSPEEYDMCVSHGYHCIPVYNCQDGITEFPPCRYALSEINLASDNWEDDLDYDYLYHVFQRFNHIPWNILETKRMSLRESTVEDVDRFYEIYALDPDIWNYVESLFDDPKDEKLYQKNYISEIYERYDFGIWTIDLKATGEVIGRAGLSIVEGGQYPDLGFIIRKDLQNQGLAFEICSAILEYGKNTLGFDTIQARVRPDNAKSIHLLKKLGFKIMEELKDGFLVGFKFLW